jgi:replicative DNA helicase
MALDDSRYFAAPHDDTMEEALLGGIILSPDTLGEIVSHINEDDFYQPKNKVVFQACEELYREGNKTDVNLVADKLRNEGRLDEAGGMDRLLELVEKGVIGGYAVRYADILKRESLLRKVVDTGQKITEMGLTGQSEQAEDVVNRAQSAVFALGDDRSTQHLISLQSSIDEASQLISNLQSGNMKRGLSTGFSELDKLTNGLQPGQLVIVAGRPAMGKSTLAMDFARHAALHERSDEFPDGIPTAYFSLEMGHVELTERLLSAESNVPLAVLLNPAAGNAGRPDDRDWSAIERTRDAFSRSTLMFDDSASMSLMEIRAACRSMAAKSRLGLVVIDYLQLLSSTQQVESRQQEVSEFSRSLKLLAKELDVPVIALSQLNRGPEQRQDKKPQLSDLRESGSIEQDADMVLLVHRPDQYDPDDRPGEADIIVAKNRNGKTGTVTLTFEGDRSRFSEPAADAQQI